MVFVCRPEGGDLGENEGTKKGQEDGPGLGWCEMERWGHGPAQAWPLLLSLRYLCLLTTLSDWSVQQPPYGGGGWKQVSRQ